MSEISDDQSALRCQWCGVAAASAKSTNCAACGAALILRESIGDLVIPGVTDVDPELVSYARRPLRIPKGSPTQALAGYFGPAVAVDPIGLVALGALAAVAAQELAGASQGRGGKRIDPEKLGVPSAPVLDMVNRLNEEAEAAEEPPDDLAPAPPED